MRKSSQQRGADGSFIQPGKHHVVPVGQRAAAGNDLAVRILPQRLELPHRADPLEVADALALVVEDTDYLVIHVVQAQRVQFGQLDELVKSKNVLAKNVAVEQALAYWVVA